MKKKELTDIKSKSVKDLNKMVYTKKLEISKSGMQAVTGKQKNLKESKNLRRDVAQLLTIIKEKQIIEKLEVAKETTK
ncbi:MAG TPA: 50S ribosomal protein L29 [Patescibacteria group bacterium]|nr:50S ribosomal protein L29 [Patescibacteria group bacterium]